MVSFFMNLRTKDDFSLIDFFHLQDPIKTIGQCNMFDLNLSFNIQLVANVVTANNNHNPNNKTTITVVGLRQSNHWEHYSAYPTDVW